MQGYLAIRSTHGSATFCQCDLSVDDIMRLRSQVPQTATAVYMLKAADLSEVVANSALEVASRGKKHAAKALSSYFAGKTGLVSISTAYRNPGQAERGIRALLAAPQICEKGATFLIGIDESLFTQLWSRATGSQDADRTPRKGATSGHSNDFNDMIAQLPGLPIPPPLRDAFRGSSAAADRVRRMIVLAAKAEHPVLIEGATGTGKEVVARQIHALSGRKTQPFLTVNCGGIPSDLLESELFGHEKGSFTGAYTDKDGLWTLAAEGTLFLDEIGDLSRQHQVKILRALEDGEYRPVGGTKNIKSGARIIAATNRDLAFMVSGRQFREDLYFRLFTFRIRTPALREHPDDIPELAERFWQKIAGKNAAPLPRTVLEAFKACPWPGNARELRAFLINVYMLAGTNPVTVPMIRAVIQERVGPLACTTKDPSLH